jgi:dihydropyrimidine dehydrogenase (NAD+) subunit PreA
MPALEVTFAGIRLRNPLIMASAPPTETIENIVRCADAGAAAVVTKTLADFDAESFPLGARRTMVDRRGLWALSTFRRETLTAANGLRLVEEATARVDIPIIASVGALAMDPAPWVRACKQAEEAGAAMVQLDLFYAPHPRSSPENVKRLSEVLDATTSSTSIPIVPKLNIDFPAHHMAQILSRTEVGGAFAIDSLRVPVALDPRRGGTELTTHVPNAPEASLFGGWQKPITLQYVRTLAEHTRLDIGAGGGLVNGYDAIEAMMLGAATVQVATTVIRHGFKRISLILDQMDAYLADHGHAQVSEVRGIALDRFAQTEDDLAFADVKAVVDHETCIMCGHCTELVFCPDVRLVGGRIEILDHCDGCGLCVSVCPTQPKALQLISASSEPGG